MEILYYNIMTQIEFLTDIIKASQYGHPIYTKQLSASVAAKFGLEKKKADTATAVSMKRILERKLIPNLKYHQRGIYYLAKSTPFGDTPIDSNLLVFDRYLADDTGYESGLGELHVLGLTSQMPKRRLFVSNSAYGSTRIDKKNDIIIKPPRTTVHKGNKAYLQILDAIDLVDKAFIDAENPCKIILFYIKASNMDFAKLLALANNYYSRDVVLKLANIASAGGTE